MAPVCQHESDTNKNLNLIKMTYLDLCTFVTLLFVLLSRTTLSRPQRNAATGQTAVLLE